MHLLTTSSTNLDEIVEAVDLGQTPGDIAVLSFADSDLAALAAAWEAERASLPSVRLAHLRDLRHPMSVDLWIDRVGAHAKVIVVRLLGGLDWWKYGIERLSALARERGIALAVLPGEDRDDVRLAAASTLPAQELDALLRFFREGGRDNLRALLRRLAHHAGHDLELREPQPVPRLAGYLPGEGAVDLDRLAASLQAGHPVVPIVFYRALLLADDTAPVDALCAALAARGLAPAALFVTSLKDREAGAFLRQALERLKPSLIVTMTAFAAGGAPTSRRRSTRRASRCSRSSAPSPNGRRGATVRAASAPPILPCMWCCPSSTAACWPAPSRSRTRCQPRPDLPSALSPAGPSRTASPWWRIGSPRILFCRPCRRANAGSPS